ncbi:hypothetical protein M5D96_003657, partial [Drosophila gunungcola]
MFEIYRSLFGNRNFREHPQMAVPADVMNFHFEYPRKNRQPAKHNCQSQRFLAFAAKPLRKKREFLFFYVYQDHLWRLSLCALVA